VSGGSQYHIDNVVVHVYTDRTGTTDGSATNFPLTVSGGSITSSGTTRYVPVTSANLLNILNYYASIQEITRIGLAVTTHYNNDSNSKTQTVYLTPPTMASSFSISAFFANRGANDGTNTTAESITSTIAVASNSPFYQYGTFPSNITIGVRRTNSSGTQITMTAGPYAGGKKSWTGSDSWTIPLTDGTYVYWMQLLNGTTQLATKTYTVPPSDVFISMIKGSSVANHKLGVGTGNPSKMLDVKQGAAFASAADWTYCAGKGVLIGQAAGYMLQWGTVSITPTAANTPTSVAVTFSPAFLSAPYVWTTPITSVPGKEVTGTSGSNVTATGADIVGCRTNTVSFGVRWLAIGQYRSV
jgi:hypothetical protein